ncbi:MAG: CDP-alcohol phosphatidyltransferase family protein [Chitinophagaceae bacterium]
MKHLPNILTLGNLFFGCMAIVYILHAQPFLSTMNGEQYWVSGTEQVRMASIFIALAALCDVFDGMAARWLGVSSPLGKDLDSLADVVSFGVAPSMILFKMLWASWMLSPKAIDVSMWAMCPALLIACFGALRLARFNNSPSNTSFFTGVPIPAVGLLIASFPYINFYNTWHVGFLFQHAWFLYIMIGILCWLMVSKLSLFTIKFSDFSIKKYRLQLIWFAMSLICVFIFQFLAIPIAFILYILLSIFYKPKTT